MKPLRIRGFAIALCLSIAAHALADPTPLPLTDKVPADALIYVGWSGSDSLQQSYDASHLKAVLSASNFPDVISQLIPQLINKADDPQAKEAFTTAQAAAAILWKHPTAFYFRDAAPPTAPTPKFRAALICDAGADNAALLRLFRKLVSIANGSGLVAGSADNLVWLTAPNERPDQTSTGLNTSDAFTSVMSHLQPAPALAIYLDIKSGLNLVNTAATRDPNAAHIWPGVRNALGLTDISAIALTTGFDGPDWASSACLIAPAPRTGLLAAIEPAAPDPALLARVPDSATLVSATRFDAGKFLDSITAAFATNPDASKTFHMGLGAANMFLGRNLRNQILGSLGDQWVTYSTSPTSFMFVNKPTDPTAAADGLTSALFGICNAINIRFGQPGKPLVNLDTQSIQGISITTASAGPIKPSIAVNKGILYIGDSPQSVIAAATAPDSPQPDITSGPEFAAALKRLNAPAVKGFDFVNLPKTVPASYPLISSALATLPPLAQKADLRIPQITLPPQDQILANVSPALGVNWSDDTGIYSKEISPFPASGIFGNSSDEMAAAGSGALVAAILLPALDRAKENAKRVACASNERQISIAILMYANDHKGNYPPDLGTLVSSRLLPLKFSSAPQATQNSLPTSPPIKPHNGSTTTPTTSTPAKASHPSTPNQPESSSTKNPTPTTTKA